MIARRALAAVFAFAVSAPSAADAFCGFYVSGADAKLTNDATLVVLMRGGQKTVLSMQNTYKGPPENFALVIPVPTVLQKDDVKTLPRALFDKVDQLGSPRLVEYWEQDPCAPGVDSFGAGGLGLSGIGEGGGGKGGGIGLGSVKVEARFEVGEYEIVILSAKDSTGLDAWLRENKYKIPDGAEPHLRPYVQAGSKFFVAKVNVAKVKIENGQALLSPLRFHYDSERVTLPIKLGLINSQGTQDLVVNILSNGTRYEAANYPNATIPTNLDVADATRTQFGAFYNALFDRTIAEHPRAVVTEYAWDSGSCDPCPGPTLDSGDLESLGRDVVGDAGAAKGGGLGLGGFGGMVLTRLHVRYGKESLGEDLVFRAVAPIEGGREPWGGPQKSGAHPAAANAFQARYAIRHKWQGKITCDNPRHGVWGGPPRGDGGAWAPAPKPTAATRIAAQPRGGVQLASLLNADFVEPPAPSAAAPSPSLVPPPSASAPSAPPRDSLGCFGCTTSARSSTWWALVALAAPAIAVARRRRR